MNPIDTGRFFPDTSPREMYRSAKRVSYDRPVYMARIKLKSGLLLEVPFDCEGKSTPYDFVLAFLFIWIWRPRELELLELFQFGVYQESYTPKTGWWKEGREPFPY